MTCSTFHILIGPKSEEASCGRTFQIIFWITSTLITFLTRILILVFCIYQSNSIVVTLYPPNNIYRNNTCSHITEVNGYLGYNFYNESEKATLYYQHQNLTMFHSGLSGEPNLLMSDEYNYQLKYYYCGDITGFLNTFWIPLLTWFTFILLPQLLLSTLAFIIMFRSKSFSLLLQYPGFTLTSLASHHNIGPVSWSGTTSPGLIHSQILTYFNILLTFIGMGFIIKLTTAGFGNGDGSQLTYVLTLVISIPIITFSGIFALVFMHGFQDCGCCCKLQRTVFNPEDPGKLEVMGQGEILSERGKI